LFYLNNRSLRPGPLPPGNSAKFSGGFFLVVVKWVELWGNGVTAEREKRRVGERETGIKFINPLLWRG